MGAISIFTSRLLSLYIDKERKVFNLLVAFLSDFRTPRARQPDFAPRASRGDGILFIIDFLSVHFSVFPAAGESEATGIELMRGSPQPLSSEERSMNQAGLPIVEFFKEFGNLIDTALIVSLGGLLLKILRATIGQKEAQIANLGSQLKAAEMFSAKNVKEQFDALQEWYDRSIRKLEDERQKAVASSEIQFRKKIDDEIAKRTEIFERYTKQGRPSSDLTADLKPHQLRGNYRVVGHNPHSPQVSYFGELVIKEREEVLYADWTIGPTKQKLTGLGVVLGNAIAFQFADVQTPAEAGVVLYRFIGADVMTGSWTGFGAETIGFEECRKLQNRYVDGEEC
jgi:hypothetical protein